MGLGICCARVDENGLELVEHGTTLFPIACYYDDLANEEVPWHWHDELEAAVITDGRAIVTAGEQKYIIGPGEGFFINSGILHGAWDIDDSGCRFHSLVFHPRLVGGSLDSVFYQNYILPLIENQSLEGLFLQPGVLWQKAVLDAIEESWQACVNEPDGYEFLVRSALSQLVFQIHSHLPAFKPQSGGKANRNAERIKIMLQYIHDHFANEISTRHIAQSATVSESECLRCFRATIGTTPIQYLKQYRIQRAAQLLLTTQDKIADIGTQCGFQDVSYFTKTFRQAKGCTPSQYRQSSQ